MGACRRCGAAPGTTSRINFSEGGDFLFDAILDCQRGAGGFLDGSHQFHGPIFVARARGAIVVLFDLSHAEVEVQFADGFIKGFPILKELASATGPCIRLSYQTSLGHERAEDKDEDDRDNNDADRAAH